jgi:hypothetical protein
VRRDASPLDVARNNGEQFWPVPARRCRTKYEAPRAPRPVLRDLFIALNALSIRRTQNFVPVRRTPCQVLRAFLKS